MKHTWQSDFVKFIEKSSSNQEQPIQIIEQEQATDKQKKAE
jgi:hypothetical protein